MSRQSITTLWDSNAGPRMPEMGHEGALPPHRPNAGSVIGKETFAWARRSGRDAPKPDLAAGKRPPPVSALLDVYAGFTALPDARYR